MKILLDTLPLVKEYYQETDFPANTFAGVTKPLDIQTVTNGALKNRSYLTYSFETPKPWYHILWKGLSAFLLTVFSLGFGLFSPYVRDLWADASTLNDSIDMKVLQPEFVLPAEDKGLFENLKEILTTLPIDNASALDIMRRLQEIKTEDFTYEQHAVYIEEVNKIRKPFLAYRGALTDDEKKKTRAVRDELDKVAYHLANKKFHDEILNAHFYRYEQKFKELDGKILHSQLVQQDNGTVKKSLGYTQAPVSATFNLPCPSGSVASWSKLPGFDAKDVSLKIKFTHLPALSQVDGSNGLCSYYSLFFLCQSVKGESLCDRAAFMAFSKDLIWKRIRNFALGKLPERAEIIPSMGFSTNTTSLNPGLITNFAKEMELLKDKNCFVLDTYNERENAELGVSIENFIHPISGLSSNQSFPLHLIYQGEDHFYYIKVDKDAEGVLSFTMAHSLSLAVHECWQNSPEKWNVLINHIAYILNPPQPAVQHATSSWLSYIPFFSPKAQPQVQPQPQPQSQPERAGWLDYFKL